MKILVLYDGTIQSKQALKYGIEKVKESNGKLTALYVFNSNLFIGCDSFPGGEDVARREAKCHVHDAETIVSEAGEGLRAIVILEEGDYNDVMARYAKNEEVDLVLAPPRLKEVVNGAPCPVAVVPGHILVTVDNTDSVMNAVSRIISEAKTSASEVVLLGIVPEHIYSLSEKGELEKVRKETLQIMSSAARKLKKEGITVKKITGSGYPDEEIIKVAYRYPGAIIMIPDSGDIPSELGKAAQMLLDEQDTVKLPLQVVPVSRL